MGQVTGIVYVSVNGKRLRSKEGASLDIGGKERTAIVAAGRVTGYSEKVVPSVLSCTLAHTSDTDLLDIGATVDATATFETDTGLTYIMAGVFCTKPPKVTGGEGDVEVEFSGEPAEEG